jgi:hypothetical protein
MKSITKTYQFDELQLEIIFEEKIWRIPSSVAFSQFVDKDPQHLNELYELLQQDHAVLFGTPINISRASFVVEVWAHLFVEKFLREGKKFIGLRLLNKLIDQVIKRTAVIDCGEAPHDSNRKIWDQLAKFFDPISNRISNE